MPEVDNAIDVSTHSRAEAAAELSSAGWVRYIVSTHSRAEAAAIYQIIFMVQFLLFQHTAARRRLQIW